MDELHGIPYPSPFETIRLIGARNRITAIKEVDQPDYRGAKEFEIRFENTVNPSIHEGSGFGIENLEWTPTVLFSDNVIRDFGINRDNSVRKLEHIRQGVDELILTDQHVPASAGPILG